MSLNASSAVRNLSGNPNLALSTHNFTPRTHGTAFPASVPNIQRLGAGAVPRSQGRSCVCTPHQGIIFHDRGLSAKFSEGGTTREGPLAFGALAQGARHQAETARETALACRRRFTSSTWYRRRKRARDAATACANFARADLSPSSFLSPGALAQGGSEGGISRRRIDPRSRRCAALERETMAIIAELTAYAAGGRQAMRT